MKDFMLRLAMAAAACLAIASPALAAPTPDQLIDQLAQIDCHAPGLYPHFPYEDFWAVVPDPDPKSHLEGREPDCVPDAMRALVRLGPQALPALIRHIGDAGAVPRSLRRGQSGATGTGGGRRGIRTHRAGRFRMKIR